MRFIHGIRLGIVVAPLLIFDCECPGPEISSMTPGTGPGGTIVEVEFTGGGIEGTIQFDQPGRSLHGLDLLLLESVRF